MKKRSLLYITLLLVAVSLVYPSCKRVYHDTKPTPGNYRLLSYTKVTTQTIMAPFTLTPIITENYRFVYDSRNRVSQIFYTTNDSVKVNANMANLSMVFTYVADSIFKTITDMSTATVKERDTFFVNSFGQITHGHFPRVVYDYSYYGKLLAKETVTYRDTNVTVSANSIYTSNNGDFLNKLFDGVLTARFGDSGIRPFITAIDTVRDTLMTLPIDITWTTYNTNGTVVPTVRTGVGNFENVFSPAYQNYITVDAIDGNGVRARTGSFPARSADRQFYEIYDFLDNRPGDYLQLSAFTTYGMNIYNHVHLVKRITTPYFITNVAYTIDADSKITHSSVVIRDSLLKNEVSEQYKLQYETY